MFQSLMTSLYFYSPPPSLPPSFYVLRLRGERGGGGGVFRFGRKRVEKEVENMKIRANKFFFFPPLYFLKAEGREGGGGREKGDRKCALKK